MNLLAYTKYGDRAASARQRYLQFAGNLRAANITLQVVPLLDNSYLGATFSGLPASKMSLARSYAHRFGHMLRGCAADGVWLQYEFFPSLPAFFETLALPRGIPFVVDYDDAIFHQYDQHKSPIVRAMLGGKLKPLLRRYGPAPVPGTDGPITVGWIGSPSTWTFVKPLVPLLMEAAQRRNLAIRIVGAGPQADVPPRFEFLPWSETDEIALIQGMDIGIMPLPDEPWARGKSGYKLIQYMACGLPVIASPVGINSDIVGHGENGFVASTPQEWAAAIDVLAGDSRLRRAMGAAGRLKIERAYSLAVHGPRLAGMLHEVMEEGRRRRASNRGGR